LNNKDKKLKIQVQSKEPVLCCECGKEVGGKFDTDNDHDEKGLLPFRIFFAVLFLGYLA